MLEFPETTNANDAQWFVLHVKPRQEQCVSDHLGAIDAFAYFPKIEQVRFYGKRKVKRELALFPGYIFFHGIKEDAYSVDRARGIVQIIDPPDQEELAWELKNLQFALEHDAPLVECSGLKAGVYVEVQAGPMKGMQGRVERTRSADRIVLQVSMLGRAMSVEIDGSLLNRIDSPSDAPDATNQHRSM